MPSPTFPVRYTVGQAVVITPECLRRMHNSNRSAVHPGYPSDVYVAKAAAFVGVAGIVTNVFPPGYEVTAEFGGRAFHMKDSWIVPVEATFGELDIGEAFLIAPNGPTLYTKSSEDGATTAYGGVFCLFTHPKLEVRRATYQPTPSHPVSGGA